jgi:SAM-dependent methyltransferase
MRRVARVGSFLAHVHSFIVLPVWSPTMHSIRIVLLAILLCVQMAALPAPAWTQAASSASSPSDQQVYEAFRFWVTKQPPGNPVPALDRYRKVLADEGLSAAEVDRRLKIIATEGRRLEVDRWNSILTAENPMFNTEPNDFLVRMTKGRPPGRALDVGMGQGRNALYLAQQGWNVTGFDPAEKAVAAAREQAKRMGVTVVTYVEGDETFDFGRAQWDLVVLSYVGVRHLVAKLSDAMKPGGLVVVEGFHRDATKNASIGGGVVFDTNELLKLFASYRVIQYEDADAIGDFGKTQTRVVRLAAQKP